MSQERRDIKAVIIQRRKIPYYNYNGVVKEGVEKIRTMRTIYLLSEFYTNLTDNMIRDIKNDIAEGELIFIPSTPYDIYLNNKYLNQTIDRFRDMGINFGSWKLLDYRSTANEIEETFKRAGVIDISGGDTSKQLSFMKETKLDEYLRNFDGLIMGVSAGAINLERLSLTDIKVHPHYDADTDIKDTSYGLTDGSGIRIKDSITLYGDIYYL